MERYKQCVYPQLRLITLLFLGTLAVAVWQREFVIAGAMSNLYLNGAIFGGLFLGVALHYWNVLALKDEFLALEALYEVYNDARKGAAQSDLEASVVYKARRMAEPAIVFTMPKLLGNSFKLLYSQLQRDGTLKIPTGTAKVLIEDLENRLVDRVGFQGYVAGLMVLLGLLGTFIGLLATVGSVGEIIASIDLSGSAGPDAIQDLLNKLEAPLAGMATGFSSSLFGLIGSLMLGMMTKINGRAENALRQDFEDWINRVAQIEQIGEASLTAEEGEGVDFEALRAATPESPTAMRVLLKVARATVHSNAQMTQRVETLCAALDAMARDADQGRRAQAVLVRKLDETNAIQAETLGVVRDSLARGEAPVRRLGEVLERLDERIAVEHQRSREAHSEMAAVVSSRSADTLTAATAATESLRQELERLGESWDASLARLRQPPSAQLAESATLMREQAALLYGIDALLAEVADGATPANEDTKPGSGAAAEDPEARGEAPGGAAEADLENWALDASAEDAAVREAQIEAEQPTEKAG